MGTGRREAEDTEVVEPVRDQGLSSSSTSPDGRKDSVFGGRAGSAGGGTTGSKPCCGKGAETVAEEAEVTIADRCRCCEDDVVVRVSVAVIGGVAAATTPDAIGPTEPVNV